MLQSRISCTLDDFCLQCCWKFFVSVELNARFTTNGKCAKKDTHKCVAWTSIIKWPRWVTSNNACEPSEHLIVQYLLMVTARVISSCYLNCCLLPQCEALSTSRSSFSIAIKLFRSATSLPWISLSVDRFVKSKPTPWLDVKIKRIRNAHDVF